MIQEIELLSQPNHINPYLTHWTGRKGNDKKAFEILEEIIKNKQLKFGNNRNSYPNSTVKVKNTMICFTDTPIEHSILHCNRYNYFGISFNKEKLIKYGANPVLYIVYNRKHHQEFYVESKVKGTLSANNDCERNNLAWISSIMQPFKTRNLEIKNFPEYIEREWRIIRVLPSEYNQYKEDFNGEITIKNKVKKGKNIESYFLNFNPLIIEKIIVPNHYKSEGLDLIEKYKLKCDILILKNPQSKS